jgi:hypothetical protein
MPVMVQRSRAFFWFFAGLAVGSVVGIIAIAIASEQKDYSPIFGFWVILGAISGLTLGASFWKKHLRLMLSIIIAMVCVAGAGWLYHRWLYPYGWSHSCDSQLMLALDQYAQDHGGAYPAGEATPEASLSLLYPKYANEWVLQGKTVPLAVVKQVLERGDRLGPDTCGWHYVEGLTLSDDPKLALCWDKIGLGHNGERLSDGGHEVLFVHMGIEYIPGAKWPEFLKEQEKLLAQRKKGKHD